MGGCDLYMRNFNIQIIVAETKKRAVKKLLTKKSNKNVEMIIGLFSTFMRQYGDDNGNKKFPHGETKFYYDQLAELKLVPVDPKGDWDAPEILNINECIGEKEEEENIQNLVHSFVKKNLKTLVPYWLDWVNDGREISCAIMEN